MAADKVRMGVIGVGSWANRIHIPQIQSHPGAELVALCARTEEKLRKAGEDFGVEGLYTDHEKMLAEAKLDAVTISSTHEAHYRLSKAALEAGLHVFCEKPLGINSIQTAELVELARKQGAKTMVAFTNRWVPEAIYVKRLMAEGYVGECFHYNACQLAAYLGPASQWRWRADAKLGGGGVLYDLGCHNIDLAMWLNGRITAVCGLQKNTVPQRPLDGKMLPTSVDDTNAFVAEFENGAQGIFHISWTCPGDRLMRHEIAGRDGFLRLNLFHDVWINSLAGCRTGEPEAVQMTVPDDVQGAIPRAVATAEERQAARQAFLLQSPSLVRAFIDSIVQDTTPSPSFEDGHAAQQVMDALIISNRQRRWVRVGEVV
jgi:predicted dehydrogenase